MYPPQELILKGKFQTPDGIGGFSEDLKPLRSFLGYIDLITGTDQNAVQQAFVEDSTHVAVIPKAQAGITDAMRLVDASGRWYEITYVDDPVGVGHHTELYLKYGGVEDDA